MVLLYGIVTLFIYGSIKSLEAKMFEASTHDIKLYKITRNKFYYIDVNLKGTWFEAQNFCSAHGMTAISVDTKAEDEVLRNILRNFQIRLPGDYWFWTSGTNWTTDKHWVWLSTGKTLIYTNWATGAAEKTESAENCLSVSFNPKRNPFTLWYAKPCGSKDFHAFPVCEKFQSKNGAKTIGKSIPCIKDPRDLNKILFSWIVLVGFMLMDIMLGDMTSGYRWISLITVKVLCMVQP